MEHPKTFEEWLDTGPQLYDGLDAARSAWDAATVAERERCATLVEGSHGWRSDTGAFYDNLAYLIRE